MSETTLHIAVAEYLDLALPEDCVWTTVGHGAVLPKQTGRRLKRMGLKAGIPDMLFMYHGKAFFIELKTIRGVLSEAQKIMQPRIRHTGFEVHICRSIAEVEMILGRYRIPLKAGVLA